MTGRKKTAAELIAELSADPAYLARQAELEAERKSHWDNLAKATQPIVDALFSAGVELQVLWDLFDGRELPSVAVPILLENVRKPEYPDQIKDMMLRALGSPVARPYWSELVALFERNAARFSPDVRFAAAVALDGVADDTLIEDVFRLARDQRLGSERMPLLLTLKRSKDPRARMLLLELRDDPDLGKEVKKMRRLARRQEDQPPSN